MADNLEVQDVRIKYKIDRRGDQVIRLNIKGDTMAEIISKAEIFAHNGRDEIENIGQFKVKDVEISLGENAFWDLGAIFR